MKNYQEIYNEFQSFIKVIENEVLNMVIHSNMSPKAIVEVWEDTEPVFKKYNVPLTERELETTIDVVILPKLLNELNFVVGSSAATCIEGG
ncbi:hypothetical protein ABLO26_11305 [Neobacillus sp. 179-J 1A1 HS]|uniref:hypothetical protein n=1 Tax=Neobacillus driksii TaxID=3035913 RepID=UPI0035BBBBA1